MIRPVPDRVQTQRWGLERLIRSDACRVEGPHRKDADLDRHVGQIMSTKMTAGKTRPPLGKLH